MCVQFTLLLHPPKGLPVRYKAQLPWECTIEDLVQWASVRLLLKQRLATRVQHACTVQFVLQAHCAVAAEDVIVTIVRDWQISSVVQRTEPIDVVGPEDVVWLYVVPSGKRGVPCTTCVCREAVGDSAPTFSYVADPVLIATSSDTTQKEVRHWHLFLFRFWWVDFSLPWFLVLSRCSTRSGAARRGFAARSRRPAGAPAMRLTP